MGREQPSMQDLIRARLRTRFVGRREELAAFRANFDVPPQDERHRFLFHIHGDAGVGKTYLVRELEQLAAERGALTAYVDEAAGGIPEAMAALSRQFARQDHRLKELDRMLAAHRERRHEAEAASLAALDTEPAPSPAGMTAARAGLVGLGMIPGVGPFAGAVDPAQLAHGADRLRAGLSARLRSQDDVQLVLSPERVLTPILLKELAEAADCAPWLVLFFDTYERTAPFLDGWLCELMTTDRYGALPANVVVVTAGQRAFDTARWGGYADFVTDVPLGPFTEAEARGLLAGKGVLAEPVVEEVLRLSGGLPVLVSTLAESRPADPGDVGDPSATAVDRFLKWERDPARREVALACALPRRLDADVFRAAAQCTAEEAPALFAWLRSLPFVSDRPDRVQYHDVVRKPMLRLQRAHSPRGWAERHARLAETFATWRAEQEAGRPGRELWADAAWRELRLAESYHRLCAAPRGELPDALRDFALSCDAGETAARQWALLLAEAGEDADAEAPGRWGRELGAALADGGTLTALQLLLDRAGFGVAEQSLVRRLRGSELRKTGEYERALAEYDAALALDPASERAHAGRGLTRMGLRDFAAAVTDLDRAVELAPRTARHLFQRGECHRALRAYEAAVRDLSRAVELEPGEAEAWAALGDARHGLGDHDQALQDLNRAIGIAPESVWPLLRRARLWRSLKDRTRQLEDLDRAVRLDPESALAACERGDALRAVGQYEEAIAEFDRAIRIQAEYTSAYASRGVAYAGLRRTEEALADLDRALELDSDYAWALTQRSWVHALRGSYEEAFADADRAAGLLPNSAWVLSRRADALRCLGRLTEARECFDRALELEPDYAWCLGCRGTVLHELGSYRQALTDLDRALDLDSDKPWLLMNRVLTCLAVGRLEQAQADLARCAELAVDPSWVHHRRAELLLLEGRPEEAVMALRAVTDFAGLHELGWAYRKLGLWDLARRTDDAYRLALAVHGSEGAVVARPLWRSAVRQLDPSEWRADAYVCRRVVAFAGLGDWPRLDAELGALFAAPRLWIDLAWLVSVLTELLAAPGADRVRLAPRLAAVEGVRDAVRAEYADLGVS
ncbi:tetratricopeptide repeat protein [Streptomyces sp. ODS28]|uniref:tetratricopeptide repeat protein n=1 Tax=Streptomyces sp. ODS28 TaxID=3136688 RepID=UPI0031EAF0FD